MQDTLSSMPLYPPTGEATNESSSHLNGEGSGGIEEEEYKMDISTERSSCRNVDTPSKQFSADAAAKAQLHALTRETYTLSLRQLRQERLKWRMDKLELDHLRSRVMANDNSVSTTSQIQTLLEEKAHQEEQLEACHDEIQTYKELLHTMQTEQKELKRDLEHTQQELQQERSQRGELLFFYGQSSMSSVYHSSEQRRMQDLQEQIHKWETLFFESAEMGERQIQRLEEELEQLREELIEARDTTPPPTQIQKEVTVHVDPEVQQLQKRVQELENEVQQKQEQLESQEKVAKQQKEEWDQRILDMSTQPIPQEAVVPDPFADRLAALAKEMNNREASTKCQHDIELKESQETIDFLRLELSKANQTIAHLEKQSQLPAIIPEEDSDEDMSTSRSGDDDLEQYAMELEKQIGLKHAENQELKERLEQERLVAKNREDILRRQLDEAREIVSATESDTLLDKVLQDVEEQRADSKDDEARVKDLEARLQQTKNELEKSEGVAKELRQKLEISLQANSIGSTSLGNESNSKSNSWEKERLHLLNQIDSQQKLLDDARRRIDATQRENSQLRQVKDSLMGIDREMEELIESLEPLQNELAEKTRQAEDARAEAAALKQELNRETAKRQDTEREKKAFQDEAVKKTDQLNKVYIELKDEQTAREKEMEWAKQELSSLKQSLEYYKSGLEVLQEAMHEANEEIRKSSPSQDDIEQVIAERDEIRRQNDRLRNEILDVRKLMERKSIETQNELSSLREKIIHLESEKDALELEASMSMQESASLKEKLQIVDDDRAKPRKDIEALRLPATLGKQQDENKIRKAEEILQKEKPIASLVTNPSKRMNVNRQSAAESISDLPTKSGKSHRMPCQLFQSQHTASEVDDSTVAPQTSIAIPGGTSNQRPVPATGNENVSDKQKFIADFEHQKLPSVKDIVRATHGAEKSQMTTVKLKKEEPQRPSVSVKDMLHIYQK